MAVMGRVQELVVAQAEVAVATAEVQTVEGLLEVTTSLVLVGARRRNRVRLAVVGARQRA
jgi:hypothetical protein